MIVRFEMLKKSPDLKAEDFAAQFRGSCAPLATRLPGLRRFHQNNVVDKSQLGVANTRVDDYDAFTQLWFDDQASMKSAVEGEIGQSIRAAGRPFLAQVNSVTAVQNIVVAKVEKGPLIKRMVVLRRREGVSSEKFMSEWFNLHAILVTRLSGVVGYTQNFVVDRARGGDMATYQQLPIDGIVELWFRDMESIKTAYATDEAATLMRHGAEFISGISTFLVKTDEVV